MPNRRKVDIIPVSDGSMKDALQETESKQRTTQSSEGKIPHGSKNKAQADKGTLKGSEKAKSYSDGAERAVQGVQDYASGAGESIRNTGKSASDAISSKANDVKDGATDGAKRAVGTVQDYASEAGESIQNVGKSASDAISSKANDVKDGAADGAKRAVGAVQDYASGAKESIQNVGKSAADVSHSYMMRGKETLEEGVHIITDSTSNAAHGIYGAVQQGIEAIKIQAQNVRDGIEEFGEEAKERARLGAEAGRQDARDQIESLNNTAEKIRDNTQYGVASAQQFAAQARENIHHVVGAAISRVQDLGHSATEKIREGTHLKEHAGRAYENQEATRKEEEVSLRDQATEDHTSNLGNIEKKYEKPKIIPTLKDDVPHTDIVGDKLLHTIKTPGNNSLPGLEDNRP